MILCRFLSKSGHVEKRFPVDRKKLERLIIGSPSSLSFPLSLPPSLPHPLLTHSLSPSLPLSLPPSISLPLSQRDVMTRRVQLTSSRVSWIPPPLSSCGLPNSKSEQNQRKVSFDSSQLPRYDSLTNTRAPFSQILIILSYWSYI